MKKISRLVTLSIFTILSMNVATLKVQADSTYLENELYEHMKNWEQQFNFTYMGNNALSQLKEASKKDDYLERSVSLFKTTRFGINYTAEISYRTTKSEEQFIDSELSRIISNFIDKRMSEEEKVRAINDYLVKIFKYDDTYKSDNAYDALISGKTICQGYAMTAYKMFKILGIDCRIVSGSKKDMSHAWNLVKVGGYWYHLDITNNDNIVRDKYVLNSDEYMKANDYIWEQSDYPSASKNYYDSKTEYIDYNNDKEKDIKQYYNGGYWYKDNGDWYFNRNSGYRAIDWLKNDGKWYFLGEDGKMRTGWFNHKGNWYYCWSDGSLATNTVINGYKVDENGCYVI